MELPKELSSYLSVYAYVDARKVEEESTWFKQQKSLHNLRRKIRFAMPGTPLKDLMLEESQAPTFDSDNVLTNLAQIEKLGGDVSDESDEELSTTSNCMRSCIHNVKSHEEVTECYKVHKSDSNSTIHVVEIHQEYREDIDRQGMNGQIVACQCIGSTGMQSLSEESVSVDKDCLKAKLCLGGSGALSYVTHL